MSQNTDEVSGFMRRLAEFRASLTADQQAMLDAILDAAHESAETSGYMMNLYTTEVNNQRMVNERVSNAEQARAVNMAEQAGEAATYSQSHEPRLAWLQGWLSGLRPGAAHR